MEASAVVDPARAAEDEAFARFYRRYAPHVYRYTLAVLRNPADAEDVTQTTFMNAYRAMQAGDQPRKPHNWLIKIAHNACRSRYVMRRRRVAEVPLEDSIDQIVVPPDERPNVRAVLRALGRLPFNQRAALVMRELEGRTYAEIADTLGVSVSAVEMLIFRARKSLRTQTRSLHALGAVQLPGSLVSFFQGGGAAATAGGLVGAGVALKVIAALATATAIAGTTGGGIPSGLGNAFDLTPPAEDAPAVRQTSVSRARAHTAALARSEVRTATTRRGAMPLARAGAAERDTAGETSSTVHPAAAATTATGTTATPTERVTSPTDPVTSVLLTPIEQPNAPVPVPQLDPPQVPAVTVPALPVEPPPLPPLPKLP